MDLVTANSLGQIIAASAVAWKTPELQKELYGDLLKPGVSQAGKALGSVIGLGNTILLPLRLLNGAADAFEKIALQKFADKLSTVEEKRICPIPPEIGVPVLDRISYTKDQSLQNLFVALLATAANIDTAAYAHPAFVKIIDSISPDEAKILQNLAKNPYPGCVKVIDNSEGGRRDLRSYIINPPDDCIFPENIAAYISNLVGLGLVDINDMKWHDDDSVYSDVLIYVRNSWPNAILGLYHGFTKEKGVVAAKGYFSVTPFGSLFIKCCIE